MTSKKHYGKQTGRPITHELPTPAGGVRLETFVPWTLVRRGLKKQVITPPGIEQSSVNDAGRPSAAPTEKDDSPLLRALGLAHHWQRLLDDERVTSLTEIAEAENIDLAQASRIIRLTQLAPDLIEAMVITRPELQVSRLLMCGRGIPWHVQRDNLVQQGILI